MGKFTLIEYEGRDSGLVLAKILGAQAAAMYADEPEVVETPSETQRVIGFVPNEVEPDDSDDPDEGDEEVEEDDAL